MNRTPIQTLGLAIGLCLLNLGHLNGQEILHTIQTAANEQKLGRLAVDCGDFDQDGRGDLAIVLSVRPAGSNLYRDTLRVLAGDGSVLQNIVFQNNTIHDLAAMGDVNGDGTPDFAIMTTTGLGLISGLDGSVLATSGTLPSNLGGLNKEPIANVGDMNGDGVDDLAVGLPHGDSFGLTDNGFVAILSGVDLSFLKQVDGTIGGQRIGAELAALGDVDGDGVPDFVVGREQNVSWPNDVNEAFLISGATGAILASQSVQTFNQTILGNIQGFRVAGGGDFDGDGTPDWAISASSANLGGQHSGLIRVVSGATHAVLRDFVGIPCEGIGRSIDFADINGDGHADVISHNTSDTPVVVKQATVFSGLTQAVMAGEVGDIHEVSGTLALGDLDGDGYEDFAIIRGTPSEIFLVSGGPALGDTARSMVGDTIGLTQDVLKVNGHTGGQLHCVSCDPGAPITIAIEQPAMNALPADFAIFGRVDVPLGDESIAVPGVYGAMAVVPAPLAPSAIPYLFTLVSSVGPMTGGQIFLSGPAPWSYTVAAGFPAPLMFTLEGVIMEDGSSAAKTNAVIVRVR